MAVFHKDLIAPGAIHPAAFVGDTDPSLDSGNSVARDKCWIDTSVGPPYALKIRNALNTDWIEVGSAGGALSTTLLTLTLEDGTPVAQFVVRSDGYLDLQMAAGLMFLINGKPALCYAPTEPPGGSPLSPLVSVLASETLVPGGTLGEAVPLELVNLLPSTGTWQIYALITLQDVSGAANDAHVVLLDEDSVLISEDTVSWAAGGTTTVLLQGSYTSVAGLKHVGLYCGATGDADALITGSGTVLIALLVP